MKIGERLKKFILECYGSQKNFAELIGIKLSALNRYISDSSNPGLDVLRKFKNAGLSIDWLIDGSSSMYASKSSSRPININNESNNEKTSNTPYFRIKQWIIENYESIENYAVIMNFNYKDLMNILNNELVPDPSLVQGVVRAGCNLSWLATGEGSKYGNNPAGLLLKIQKDSTGTQVYEPNLLENYNHKNKENYTSEDFFKLIRLAIKAEFDERERKNNESNN